MRQRRWLFWALALPLWAQAQVRIESAACRLSGTNAYLNAELNIRLPETPLAALKSGISLYFVVEAQPSGRKWWQSDAALVSHQWRLRYNHLNFAYLLQKNNEAPRQFNDVSSALKALGSIEMLPLDIAAAPLQWRFQLQHTQLPAALRLSALSDAQWRLDSGWQDCVEQ